MRGVLATMRQTGGQQWQWNHNVEAFS